MTIANTATTTEYRDLPLSILTESKTNPRRIFEESALKELAESIRSQGILSPLLVRPLTERSFEIVAGARRYRAAQLAEAETVPVRIVNLTDAEALEAQLIENLQRRDVHPLEEAQGFRALLNLDEPKYSIEQISGQDRQISRLLRPAHQVDRTHRRRHRGIRQRRNRRRPRTAFGQIAASRAGTGTLRLLPRGLERRPGQGQAHPATLSAISTSGLSRTSCSF